MRRHPAARPRGAGLSRLAAVSPQPPGDGRPDWGGRADPGIGLRADPGHAQPEQPEFGEPACRSFTDALAGDGRAGPGLYSRLLYGGRATLGIVLAVVVIVAPTGLLVGTVAGYAGGLLDRILMRVTDIFLAFPALILALAFVSALRPGLTSAVIAIALTSWPPFARLARAETLAIRRADFIMAQRLIGASATRIVFRHIMPLCVSSTVVRVALAMSSIILTAAGLGFLGMGAQPPLPEWGAMIATTRGFIIAQWWVPTMPGVAIIVASLAFNLLADGLRDVLDPKQG